MGHVRATVLHFADAQVALYVGPGDDDEDAEKQQQDVRQALAQGLIGAATRHLDHLLLSPGQGYCGLIFIEQAANERFDHFHSLGHSRAHVRTQADFVGFKHAGLATNEI